MNHLLAEDSHELSSLICFLKVAAKECADIYDLHKFVGYHLCCSVTGQEIPNPRVHLSGEKKSLAKLPNETVDGTNFPSFFAYNPSFASVSQRTALLNINCKRQRNIRKPKIPQSQMIFVSK